MEIRKLEPQEHGKTRALYEEVFSEDSRSFVDYYYTEKTRDNQIYVVEEAGEIQAMLHLNPYTLMVNGSRKVAHYIVAVATRKEYRGRGYMAALLKQALTDMYQAGESFTFLMPAAEAIYLPHDFRTVYEQQRKFCSEEEYRQAPGPASEDPGILVSKAKEEESEELAEAANGWLGEHFQVYALRDAAYYRRLQKEYASDGGCLMIERENGVITGCRTYMPGETGEEKPKIMIRITDLRRMLMSLRLKSLMAVCFQVTDPILPENNRCLVLTGTEFSGVMLMDGKQENSEGTIPIGALGSFLFGAETVEELAREPGVEMTERMKQEMEKTEQEADALRQERSACYEAIDGIQQKLQKAYVVQNTAKMNLDQAKERIRLSLETTEAIRKENQELDQQITDISNNQESITVELDTSTALEQEIH